MFITIDGENWLRVKNINKDNGNFNVYTEEGIKEIVPFLVVGIKDREEM